MAGCGAGAGGGGGGCGVLLALFRPRRWFLLSGCGNDGDDGYDPDTDNGDPVDAVVDGELLGGLLLLLPLNINGTQGI